jgi:hypothetical protein
MLLTGVDEDWLRELGGVRFIDSATELELARSA